MKKFIFMLLLVLTISSPCMAQIKAQGIFTTNNTLWLADCDKDDYKCICRERIGISNNSFYTSECWETFSECLDFTIIDFCIISLYDAKCGPFHYSGILSSLLGIGINQSGLSNAEYGQSTEKVFFRKINSNWSPPVSE